ncbi:C40 family peptidase [Pseudoclavibacter sp. VKM Ac-2888]|uniref:C40 family peptidase n=1 Tax=Pseudoclavibacter sp. VKM Ac-2888 TaxID=2783830 RepID=UPI00188A5FB0|nr:C40 family peptidase [Pseudoclavibacter sp. VKM Ac-2888]MBF4549983.1 C40 family peptidase [Pseudoclavibacter sp. VKM Ac-2888]
MSTTLTRREARAIERQTGVRPVADATQSLSAAALASVAGTRAPVALQPEETGRIERNAMTSLLSVVPADRVATAATEAEAPSVPAAFAGERAMTVRAPRPRQLVVRRRVAGTLAAAASLAAVTAVGAVVPSTMAAPAPASEASLSNAVAASDDTNADAQTEQASVEAAIADAVADATPAVAAPETVTDRTETAVVSMSADQVAAVATPEPTADAAAADTSGAGSSSAGQSVAGSSVVETASQFIGVSPYVFGGATPDGFDCSGLVKYVFGLHGIDVAHGVSAQAAAGTRVSDPQPGDLVIFPNFHVGIYAGNGQMIDAPTEGRMVELGGLDAGGSYYFVRL